MEIAQVDGSNEVGTIQSIQSFSPPLTISGIVKGTVSNGHPFVFGISSANASAGIEITGNLNPDDCSSESNCGNPATCGIPANPNIPANQCFYGIYARAGSNGSGHWPKAPYLNLSPTVGVTYALQLTVNSAGAAQFEVSQGGPVIGTATAQVGTGPFYIIIAQSEGAPVPGPGPNQAYWMSVSLTPSSNYAASPPASSSSNWTIVIVVLIVLVVLALIVVFVVGGRRRGFEVRVLDARALSPVSGAVVSAEGPDNLEGRTGMSGQVSLGSARAGDYSVRAAAEGYTPSPPVTISVKNRTHYTVRLVRIGPSVPAGSGPAAPAQSLPPHVGATQPAIMESAPGTAGPGAVGASSEPQESLELAGWGGERIRAIIATFRARGAVSPETALTAEELGLSRLFVRIMKRRRGTTRVFVEVNGKYYLDESELRNMK
jgi:hypothetical protein